MPDNNENRNDDWDAVKTRLQDKSIWRRALFMLVFSVFVMMAQSVLGIVIVALFLIRLFTGRIPKSFLNLAASLSRYVYQIYRYLTFNTEKKPFPFSDWPAAEAGKSAERSTAHQMPVESKESSNKPE